MSGIIAVKALKTALAYEYSERLLNMYYDLIHDLKCNGKDRPFSDGYDLVMTAACYLCEHIGESLDDMNGVSILTNRTLWVRLGTVWWAIRDSQEAEGDGTARGNSRASHNSPSLFALPKRTSQTGSLVFSLKKKNPDKPHGDVRNLVGNKGLEPLTPSM